VSTSRASYGSKIKVGKRDLIKTKPNTRTEDRLVSAEAASRQNDLTAVVSGFDMRKIYLWIVFFDPSDACYLREAWQGHRIMPKGIFICR
jgi:hypothetical protein